MRAYNAVLFGSPLLVTNFAMIMGLKSLEGVIDGTNVSQGNIMDLIDVSGELTLQNFTFALEVINIFGKGLALTIDASCTAGTINVYGDVDITNNSTATVNDFTVNTLADIQYDHTHQPQHVAPSGAAGVTLTSGAGAWTLGAFSADIIPANGDASAGTQKFDIHGMDIEDPNANASYEIVLYGKVGGVADTEIGRATFTRTNATTVSRSTAMQTPRVDKGSRIRAKIMSSTGAGTEHCDVKVWYHNSSLI